MKLTMKLRMPTSVSGAYFSMNERRTLTLVARKDLPSCHDHIVKHLQAEVCVVLVTFPTTAFQTTETYTWFVDTVHPRGSYRRGAKHLGSL